MVKESRKERVLKAFLKLVEETRVDRGNRPFRANTEQISTAAGLDRANVSRELNQLYREGRIAKKHGRPVLYSPVEETDSLQSPVCSPRKGSKQEFVNLWPGTQQGGIDESKNPWINFIGSDGSLAQHIQQGIAAVAYPGGLNLLVTGPSGTGKTLFAQLLYQTAVLTGSVSKKAPFITFNCADYANNPELLLSQLFGHVKGSFTGADRDKPGLVKMAEGGFLFLDEIHRLPPEGQEMLYLLLDRGIYHRLGEPGNLRPIILRFIAATTENPDTTLLLPFTRRIPVLINLPPLSERPVVEKQQLITAFFHNEAKKINCALDIKAHVIDCLLGYNCTGNVGQLKDTIRLTCANALYKERREGGVADPAFPGKRDAVLIDVDALPRNVRQQVPVHQWWSYGFPESNLLPKREITNCGTLVQSYDKGLPPTDIIFPEDEKPYQPLALLIIAHGSSTASSIAAFTNQYLETDIVAGLDIPLGMNSYDIVKMVKTKLDSLKPTHNFLVFVDMPSLVELARNAAALAKIHTRVFEGVNTPLAIEAARLALTSGNTPDIIEEQIAVRYHVYEDKGGAGEARKVVLTTCISGSGTAERVRRLLTEVFPTLLASGYDIVSLNIDLKNGETAFRLDDSALPPNAKVVIAIGTIDPALPEVPFIPIENFMSGKGIMEVANMLQGTLCVNELENISKRMITSMSVETLLEHLTVLNPRIAVDSSQRFLEEVKPYLKSSLDRKTKLRLLVHIACMLERLIMGEALKYPQSRWRAPQKQISGLMNVLGKAAISLENSFSITIPEDELAVIAEILLS